MSRDDYFFERLGIFVVDLPKFLVHGDVTFKTHHRSVEIGWFVAGWGDEALC